MEGGHGVVDAMEHTTDLAIAAFVQRQSSSTFGQDLKLGGLSRQVLGVEIETLGK